MKRRSYSVGLILTLVFGLLLVPTASGPQSPSPASTIVGQSMTLLPDGGWLILGGEGAAGPLATAAIWDPRTEETTLLPNSLEHPRAYHTATLLPDGTILIIGGRGADDGPVASVEFFDPAKQTFEPLLVTSPTPRSYHTATLLTDGRLLVAGGASHQGEPLASAELWTLETQEIETLPEPLFMPRHSHSATLLPDGRVLLWGGLDRDGKALDNGELYDPESQQFTFVESHTLRSLLASDLAAPSLAASLPEDGATDVPRASLIALRFSKPLQVETVNPDTVTLAGPGGAVAATVIPDGILAFVTAEKSLLPDATYSLVLDGPTDRAGSPLPLTTLTFTTASVSLGAPAGTGLPSDAEEWIPGPEHFQGDWRSRRPDSPWLSLPPLQADPGVTALAGQLLRLDGKPLAQVTIQADGKSVRTDGTGRFLLAPLTPGHHEMVIDGGTASTPQKTYGVFIVGVDLRDGQTNVVPFTIWMPQLDMANAVRIPSPTTSEVVVTTPRIPGLEVHIPPSTIIRDIHGQAATTISITPIPTDRAPMPLPPGVEFPVFFTIQPGGANVEGVRGTQSPGIRLVFPNYAGHPPGTRIDFWKPDPEVGWMIYGKGTVTPDGKQIVPDPGVVIHELTCASIGRLLSAAGLWPPPGSGAKDGEPVDLATGLFVMEKTDLFLPDVLPLVLTRTYRNEDPASRPFGIGTMHPYEMFLVGDRTAYSYAELILPDGGRIRFNRTSPGTSYTTAVMEHTATQTRFFKSILSWNSGRGGWDIQLKDGTVYELIVYFTQEIVLLKGIQDRYGNRLSISRDSDRRITRITSPHGRWLEFTYDSSDRVTQAKDNIGRVVAYTYDADGRLATVTDPGGGVTVYTYDVAHRMLTIKDAGSIVFLTNQYDASGRVIQQTQADGTTYLFVYTVDGTGKITQTDVTDPRGNVRRVTFNADGYTLTDTRAVGAPEVQTTTVEREAGTNFVLATTDPLARRTEYVYDAMGNVTSISNLAGTPEAVTTTLTYESTFNQVASVTDPLNHTATFAYDSAGNLTTATDPLGNQSSLVYNAAGQPVSITDPLGNTTQFSYDSGDLISVSDPLGNTTTRFTDSAGRLVDLTEPLGNTTLYVYDALNRLTAVTDPLGGGTAFTFDANGNLLSLTDARASVTSYTYDNMDRLATRTDPLVRVESYQYDAGGNLTQVTDRKSQGTTFTYDGLNRRTQVTYDDLSTTTYTYDAGNRLIQVMDSNSGNVTRTYDNLDRATSETTPQGSVSYTYDAAGRRTSMTVLGQSAVNYTYDDANRLTQITQGTAVVTLTHDAAGRRTTLDLPNGITVDYAYDPASKVTGITYRFGATVLGDLTYEYDTAENRTEVGGTWARTGLPQAVGSATYDAANQMLTFGSQTLTYDANGNLTSDGSKTYTWNARNQLASMTGASFAYDGLRRRAQKTVGASTTDFLYDGVNPVQELSGGTPVANFLTGLGIDEFFTRGTETFLADALGSTVALTDSNGTVQTEYTYEPFGTTTATGTANANSFKYTGREKDGTGLYYYRLRYYSPGLHRFVSKDPFHGLGFLPQSLNGYSYVLNSPLLYVDPYGLFFDSGGATILFVDIGYDFNTRDVTLSAVYPPQIAAGVSKCSDPDTGSGGNPDTGSGGGRKDRPANDRSPREPPLEELLHPVKVTVGVNKYLGVSVDANGSLCVNFGLPIPGPAATVTVPVLKF